MLARKAACYQLRLGDAIGRNVYTARFNGRNFPTTRHLNARDILRARTQCDFFHQFVHKARVYLERDGGDVTRVNIPPPPPPPPPPPATLGRVHFALDTIATMPPLVHNLLLWRDLRKRTLASQRWFYRKRERNPVEVALWEQRENSNVFRTADGKSLSKRKILLTKLFWFYNTKERHWINLKWS